MSTEDDPRAELASVAASLRAYLEWQEDTGAMGIPRAPRRAAPAPVAVSATNEPTSTDVARAPGPAAVAAPPVAAAATAKPRAPAPPPAPSPPAFVPTVPDFTAPSAPVPTGDTVSTPAPVPAPPPTIDVRSPEERHARLGVLQVEVAGCTRCDLAATRTQTVFFRGNSDAALCFIGEAPGADEDAEGAPFVGRAGQLLDKMIGAMGLDPSKDVYVCNIIKCRPPDNRKPTPLETATCIPYLHEQLALVRPKVIVALGNTAASALLDAKLGISKLRGQWKLYKGTTLVMPTYHPSYLLRPSPQQADAKKQAWEDLQAVMKELKLPMPSKR